MDYQKILASVLFYFIEEAKHQALCWPVDEIDWDVVFNDTINEMIKLNLHDELNNDNIVSHLYSSVIESAQLDDFKHEQRDYEEECAAYSRDPLAYNGLSQHDFI